MIQPTEADIGRRVIYDPRPIIKHVSKGVLVGVEGRYALVQFDYDAEDDGCQIGPLRVFSHLKWGDE